MTNWKTALVFLGLTPLLFGCGSPQEPTQTAVKSTYRVEATFPNGRPVPGKNALLRFSIFKSATETLKAAEIKHGHERLIHAFLLDAGFLQYVHEHPVEIAPGVWDLPFRVEKAGDYALWLQVRPLVEEKTRTLRYDFKVADSHGETLPAAPADTALALTSTSGPYEVTLGFPLGVPVQHRNTQVTFAIRKNGELIPGEGLDNYLGAKIHITGISGDREDFVHVHPGHDEAPEIAEPVDKALTMPMHFMRAGYYGVFAQFIHEGEIQTVRFGVLVKGLNP